MKKMLESHDSALRGEKKSSCCGLHNMSALMNSVFTRFRNVIPEGRVELVLRLHDLGEESSLTFFVKRGVSTESARKCSTIRNTSLCVQICMYSRCSLDGAMT